MKYKVGDWVRVVEDCSGHDVGQIGIIMYVDDHFFPYLVSSDAVHTNIGEHCGWQTLKNMIFCIQHIPMQGVLTGYRIYEKHKLNPRITRNRRRKSARSLMFCNFSSVMAHKLLCAKFGEEI